MNADIRTFAIRMHGVPCEILDYYVRKIIEGEGKKLSRYTLPSKLPGVDYLANPMVNFNPLILVEGGFLTVDGTIVPTRLAEGQSVDFQISKYVIETAIAPWFNYDNLHKNIIQAVHYQMYRRHGHSTLEKAYKTDILQAEKDLLTDLAAFRAAGLLISMGMERGTVVKVAVDNLLRLKPDIPRTDFFIGCTYFA